MPDNTVVSLDADTGKERWTRKLTPRRRVELVDLGADRHSRSRASSASAATRPVGATRGFVESLDPETGASQWKWWTTPGPGEPGIETWPNPEAVAEELRRAVAAADLRSRAQPALRADRPADADLQRQEPRGRESLHLLDRRAQCRHRQDGLVLPDVAARHARLGRDRGDASWSTARIDGRPRKLLAQANRNGYFFLLDRTNGKPSSSSRSRCRIRISASTTACWCPIPAKEGTPGRHAGVSDLGRRGQLSGAVVQPRHRALLHQRHRRGQHLLPVARSRPIRPASAAARSGTAGCSSRG